MSANPYAYHSATNQHCTGMRQSGALPVKLICAVKNSKW